MISAPATPIGFVRMNFSTSSAAVSRGDSSADAVAHRDYPVVQALIFLTAFSFVIVNLLVDLTYAWFDPRIRYR